MVRDKITVIVYTKRVYDDSALESNMKIVKDAVCTLKEVSKNILKNRGGRASEQAGNRLQQNAFDGTVTK